MNTSACYEYRAAGRFADGGRLSALGFGDFRLWRKAQDGRNGIPPILILTNARLPPSPRHHPLRRAFRERLE